MKSVSKKEAAGRKLYEKPRLRVIELSADEVLAIGCKTISGGGTPGPVPCTAQSCSQLGS